MAGTTLDMHTSGPNSGQVIRPLAYTQTEDDAIRVEVFLSLATPAGKYVFDTSNGLDHERILTAPTDEERAALVRDVVLSDPRVAGIDSGPTVTIDLEGNAGPTADINLVARTTNNVTFALGLTIGA